jgi:hypothetical protein
VSERIAAAVLREYGKPPEFASFDGPSAPSDGLEPGYVWQRRRRQVIRLLAERDIDWIEAGELDLDQELAVGRR